MKAQKVTLRNLRVPAVKGGQRAKKYFNNVIKIFSLNGNLVMKKHYFEVSTWLIKLRVELIQVGRKQLQWNNGFLWPICVRQV